MQVLTLTSKGQVVIPIKVRKSLSLKKGTKLNLTTNNGKIILEIIDSQSRLSKFRNQVRQNMISQQITQVTDEDINNARSSLWNQS